LCPSDTLLDPPALLDLIRREQVEVAEFVPAVARPLMDHLEATGQTLDGMKLVAVGSDVWFVSEYRRLRALCGPRTRVINSYGLTEATVDSLYFEGATDDR